jgi:uncharacterized protein
MPEQIAPIDHPPLENIPLHEQQSQLARILEQADSVESANKALRQSALVNSDWQIEQWTPYMLETALKIAQKWRSGWT